MKMSFADLSTGLPFGNKASRPGRSGAENSRGMMLRADLDVLH
jgi:hypothetical protein